MYGQEGDIFEGAIKLLRDAFQVQQYSDAIRQLAENFVANLEDENVRKEFEGLEPKVFFNVE